MWNSYAKFNRLLAALKSRGHDPEKINILRLFRTLEKRGVTDRKLDDLVWILISLLEPPACNMAHCKHHGGQEVPCNCIAGKIPGRCSILKAYHKRRREKARKGQGYDYRGD